MTTDASEQLEALLYETCDVLQDMTLGGIERGRPDAVGFMFATFIIRACVLAPEWARYWDSIIPVLGEGANEEVRDFIASLPIEARDGGSE